MELYICKMEGGEDGEKEEGRQTLTAPSMMIDKLNLDLLALANFTA